MTDHRPQLGDIITCIDARPGLTLGKEYTVQERPGFTMNDFTRVINDNGQPESYWTRRFTFTRRFNARPDPITIRSAWNNTETETR